MRAIAAAVPVLLLLGWLATVHEHFHGPAVLPPTQAMPDQFPGP